MEKASMVRGWAVLGFVVGLFLFLTQTRSHGEALQNFRIDVLPGALTMIGCSVMGIALALFVCSYLTFGNKHNNEQP